MATRILSEADYKKHQAKFGRKAAEHLLVSAGTVMPLAGSKKRAKYGNEVVIEDGVRMASRKEMKRYRELGLLLKSGEVDFLARQVRFMLPGGVEFVADFMYGTITDPRNLKIIEPVVRDLTLEDSKGVRTRVYINKAKQVREIYGLKIIES